MQKEKSKSASKELVINTIVFGSGTLSSKIIMFILLPIYTIYMTTSELGEGELVVNFMNLLFPIATINILSALLRYGMDNIYDKKKVLQNTVIVIGIGLILFGIAIFNININSSINNWKLYLWILLACYSFQQILSVFSKTLDKTKCFAIGNVLYTVALLIISIILLVIFKRRTAGYLEGIIFANIISFIYFAYNLKINKYIVRDKPDLKLLKEMVLFSLPLIVNSLSWWIASFCDRFVLELNLGTTAVGIYSVSSKIPAIVSVVSNVFIQAWVLSAIKAYQNGNTKLVESVFKKFSALFISWAAIIILATKFIMICFIGENFSESWLYVPLLICASVFSGFGNFYGALYTSAKKNVSIMITTIIGAITNILLNLLLIPKFGIQGAVIATMVSQLIITVYRMINSRKFIKFNIDLKRIVCATIMLILESILLIYSNTIIYSLVFVLFILLIYLDEIKELLNKGLEYVKKFKRRRKNEIKNK